MWPAMRKWSIWWRVVCNKHLVSSWHKYGKGWGGVGRVGGAEGMYGAHCSFRTEKGHKQFKVHLPENSPSLPPHLSTANEHRVYKKSTKNQPLHRKQLLQASSQFFSLQANYWPLSSAAINSVMGAVAIIVLIGSLNVVLCLGSPIATGKELGTSSEDRER